MRIHRIRLGDFRGVDQLDVGFDADGVTIVSGPNEVGKSSLFDALWMLLETKDSTTAKEVRAVQPKGRDVGPWVEAELSIGAYRLRYHKRWLSGRRTELEITAPAPEHLRGAEAHDRVDQLLKQEIDMGLFRALRHQQGAALPSVKDLRSDNLASAPSLTAALDATAGANTGAGDQDRLLDRVQEEYLKYFTESRGADSQARKALAGELADARERAAQTRAKLAELEAAATRAQELELEVRSLEGDLPAADRAVAERRAAVERIGELEATAGRLSAAADSAGSQLAFARQAQQQRDRLIRSHTAAVRDRQRLERAGADAAEPLIQARAAEAAAVQAVETARERVEALEARARESTRRLGGVQLSSQLASLEALSARV
ncbi:MAG: DUF2813 domain-containing protein, partial [Solirubrobacterales bacterium]|nr:DUF2813 domain-containing protein [Solirubrobacterales bacterium]